MRTLLGSLRIPVLAALAAPLVVGCEELPDRNPDDLPDWSDGMANVATGGDTDTDTTVTPGGTQPDPPDTEFNLQIAPSTTWPFMMRRWDPVTGQTFPDEACGVDLTDAVAGDAKEVDCIAEFNEGDLDWHGFSALTHIPAGICDYLFTDSYRYQTFNIGYGKSDIHYTVDASGSITDEEGTFQGVPVCEYDYSVDGFGPNCCFGSYTLTVHDQATNTDLVSQGIWGGTLGLGRCYDGAAYLDTSAGRTPDGFPLPISYFIDKEAADITTTYNEMLTTSDDLLDGYQTNIGLANYVDVADHGGVLPKSLDPEGDLPFSAFIKPTYDFVCTDDAYEKLGIIHLTVREWNSEDEFAIDGNSNAHEGEQEPQDPFQEWDDLWDWRNYGLEGLDQAYVGWSD